jgi:hypothetical protein
LWHGYVRVQSYNVTAIDSLLIYYIYAVTVRYVS